jgi:hypothetical protein
VRLLQPAQLTFHALQRGCTPHHLLSVLADDSENPAPYSGGQHGDEEHGVAVLRRAAVNRRLDDVARLDQSAAQVRAASRSKQRSRATGILACDYKAKVQPNLL